MRRQAYGWLGLVALWVMAVPALANPKIWEVIKVDGHDYVTTLSMQKFYGFTDHRREDKKVILENKKVLMVFEQTSNSTSLLDNIRGHLNRLFRRD